MVLFYKSMRSFSGDFFRGSLRLALSGSLHSHLSLVRISSSIDLPEIEEIKKMKPTKLTLKNGITLINMIRLKSEENNSVFDSTSWTPRKIDMVLWTCGHYEERG